MAQTLVDTFELYAAEGKIRMGVTRFRNSDIHDSPCGASQSIAMMTDSDYHSGDAASYPANKLHPYYHLDAPPHIHSLTDEPLHDGIAALTLYGQDVIFGTNILKGIRCGVEQYENPLGSDRPDIPNVMILITDGEDTTQPNQDGNSPQDFIAEVNRWVDEGRLDEVFAVGIGPAEEVGYPNPNTIDSCTDGIDNGGDGFTDAADPDCPTVEDGVPVAGVDTCRDGIDNGSDGFTDDADPDCKGVEDDFPNLLSGTCTDGIDNDGDGNIDSQDHDCSLNLNAIAFDPDVPRPSINPADVYAWDHVFYANGFEELEDIIGVVVEAVKQAGVVIEKPYTVEAVAPGGTILARVVLTAEDKIVIVSWDER